MIVWITFWAEWLCEATAWRWKWMWKYTNIECDWSFFFLKFFVSFRLLGRMIVEIAFEWIDNRWRKVNECGPVTDQPFWQPWLTGRVNYFFHSILRESSLLDRSNRSRNAFNGISRVLEVFPSGWRPIDSTIVTNSFWKFNYLSSSSPRGRRVIATSSRSDNPRNRLHRIPSDSQARKMLLRSINLSRHESNPQIDTSDT